MTPNQQNAVVKPMDSGHQVRACISLNLADSQPGRRWDLPSGTRSLLFQFPRLEPEPVITLGAVVTTNNDVRLTPGLNSSVVIHFWADEAISVAQPGASFDI